MGSDAMRLILPVIPGDVTTEITRPDAHRLVGGDPVHTTWNIEDADGLYCGLWQSTPGAWKISYSEWEYVRILQGVSVLTDAEGRKVRLVAGDSWIIRPGFEGIWEVLETTLKHYVIRV
jgi:uncharacterized protein